MCLFIYSDPLLTLELSSGHQKSLNVSENYAAIQIKQFDAVLEQQFISKASTSPPLLAGVSLLSLAQLALSPETDVVHSNSDVSGEKNHPPHVSKEGEIAKQGSVEST